MEISRRHHGVQLSYQSGPRVTAGGGHGSGHGACAANSQRRGPPKTLSLILTPVLEVAQVTAVRPDGVGRLARCLYCTEWVPMSLTTERPYPVAVTVSVPATAGARIIRVRRRRCRLGAGFSGADGR
jgi:hypothetical protein